MTGKRRVAFRSGFAGVSSLGFSTLAVTQFIAPQELDQAVEDLARHLVERLGCPTWEQAREAAREEMNFSIALADQPENTIIAMHRRVEEGEIRETFRTLAARAPARVRTGCIPSPRPSPLSKALMRSRNRLTCWA